MKRPPPSIEEALPAATPLEELMHRYPEVWARTGKALTTALATGRAEEANAFMRSLHAEAEAWRSRVRASGGNPKVLDAAIPRLVAERMAVMAIQRTAFAAALGQMEGTIRLSRWSGSLVQSLFFAHGLERKPASLSLFKLLWPLVRQKRLVMPLVQQQGIYCFYTRELIQALARLAGVRSSLEIAAGDGTLSRFLRAAGVSIVATDDWSWSHRIGYPAEVVKLGAREALARHLPQVVFCSWPPPDNDFERLVFTTPSVELYVAIVSRHRFAAGDHAAYERQSDFEGGVDEELSRLVLPPELASAVLVFRRRQAA